MKRVMPRLLGLALLLAPVYALQAQTAEPVADSAAADTAATGPQQESARKDEVNDRFCLRHTGTHIRRHDDRRAGGRERCGSQFGRAYTREDLQRTGRIDIADALRALDPSIY